MTDQLLLLAQQSLPRVDSTYWLMLVSRILHILAAIVLVGGVFYLRAVVAPADPASSREGEGSSPPPDRQFGGRRAAWAMWVGIATLLLLVTGIWNYLQVYWMHERLAPTYHMIAGMKMMVALALFLLAALLTGRSPAAQKFRQNMRFWLNVCLVLGVLTVALGSVLRTFPRTPKLDAAGPEQLVAPANLSLAD
jgi:uncharacterized membrane protein